MQIQGYCHLTDREIDNIISHWKHLNLFYDAAFSQKLVGYRRPHTKCSYGHRVSRQLAAEDILWHSAITVHNTTSGYPSPVYYISEATFRC